MLGVFAEFERSIITERAIAGIARARMCGTKSGKAIGRPKVAPKIENAIRASLTRGVGILKTARELQVGSGTVQGVKAAMQAADR
jgi:DNA invertase Pin-like site-specific DNA recombinase